MLPRRIRQLEDDLNAGTTEQRLVTIVELGNSRQEYALSLLFQTINGENPDLKVAAERAFTVFVTNNTRVAIQHPIMLIRHEVAFVLGRKRVSSAVDELARVLRNDSDELMRVVCAQSLGEINNVACVAGLRVALQDRSLKVREAAFDSLRKIGGNAVELAVAELLDDHDWELRLKAHALLQSTGWVPITRRQKASWAIAEGRFDDVVSQIPEAIDPLLIATLRVNDPALREWAAKGLFRSGSDEALRKLRGALTSESADVRERAAEALKICGESAERWINVDSSESRQTVTMSSSLNSSLRSTTWMLALMGHP